MRIHPRPGPSPWKPPRSRWPRSQRVLFSELSEQLVVEVIRVLCRPEDEIDELARIQILDRTPRSEPDQAIAVYGKRRSAERGMVLLEQALVESGTSGLRNPHD